MSKRTLLIIGNIIHCIKPFTVQTLEKGFLAVRDGKIIAIDNISTLEEYTEKLNLADAEHICLEENQLLLPGFIDTHFHAPQYPNSGLGYDKTLLEWLQTYTYPLEKKYSDVEFAKLVYQTVVRRSLFSGSTTVCYFATLHLNSSLVLADAAIKFGQRAFIGKVNMTQLAPPDYVETTDQTITNTIEFVKRIREKKNSLVQPIITPRFSLSLTMAEMKKLGEIAKDLNLNIQSHISENKSEVDMVHKKFGGKSYADVYDEASLLTPKVSTDKRTFEKTVLAHGVFLEESEMHLLHERGTSISHCPDSNICLKSGLCDVQKLIREGVNVSLGTDISGGYSVSIMNVMRSAIAVSTTISFSKDDHTPLNVYDTFYLATIGGAKALALDDKVGNFKVGKEFDAIIVEPPDCFHPHTPLELLQKFVYVGDDRHILKVFVSGVQVK